MIALLPVEIVLVTASVPGVDTRSGHAGDLPVLSVVFPAIGLAQLNFDRIDPSDAMESFTHRGDVKTCRKSGDFTPITPLTVADLLSVTPDQENVATLVERVRMLRAQIGFRPDKNINFIQDA